MDKFRLEHQVFSVKCNFTRKCLSLGFRGWCSVNNFGFCVNVSPNTVFAIFKVNIMFGFFWKPYMRQAVGGNLDVMVVTGEEEQTSSSTTCPFAFGQQPVPSLRQSAPPHPSRPLLPALHRLSKAPNHYIFTLKMATAVLAGTSDNIQHLTRLIPESRVLHLLRRVGGNSKDIVTRFEFPTETLKSNDI
jgi:hypothetical protein